MFCRNCGKIYKNINMTECKKCHTPKGTGLNYCSECGEELTKGTNYCQSCGATFDEVKNYNYRGYDENIDDEIPIKQRSRKVAAIFAILFGAIGVHSFYLHNTTKGFMQIIISLIAGPLTNFIAIYFTIVWGIVDGILLLTGSTKLDGYGLELKN